MALHSVLKPVLLGVMVGLLAACQPTTSGQTTTSRSAGSGPLNQQVNTYMVNTVAAQIYAKRCSNIRMRVQDPDQDLRVFTAQLLAQGFSQQQILRSFRSLDPQIVGKAAANKILASGANYGDLASICRAGLSEISRKTAIGAYIRRA